MKRLLLLASALLSGALSLWAQIPENSYWEDGENFLQVSYRADTIDFFGGSGHDGGFDIHLLPGDRPNRYVDVGYPDNAADSIVLLKMSEGDSTRNVLVFYSNGRPNYVLKQYFPESNEDWAPGLKQILERQLHQLFEGIYVNHKMGISCRFTPGMILWSQGGLHYDTLYYTFNYEFDAPCHAITLSNGQMWWIKTTIHGIDIYNVHYWEDYDGYTPGDTLLFSLEKTWSTTEHQGRWAFTSSEVLTPGRIFFYPNEVLRLMRNEIYARHGYHFADTSLQQFFYNKVWYQEENDNRHIQLTPLEAFNVALIQTFEQQSGRHTLPVDEGLAPHPIPTAATTREYAWKGLLDNRIPIDLRLEIRDDHIAAGYIQYLKGDKKVPVLLLGNDSSLDRDRKPFTYVSEHFSDGTVGADWNIYLNPDGTASGICKGYGTEEKQTFILDKSYPYPTNAERALAPAEPSENVLRYYKTDHEIIINTSDTSGLVHFELLNFSDYDIDDIASINNGQFRFVIPECGTSVQIDLFRHFIRLNSISYPKVWMEECPYIGGVYIRKH